MFSDQYIKLCTQPEVAEKLREECKDPQVGDWFAHWGGDKWVALCWTGEFALCLDDVIPLFQPRQIIEMLEERGYNWHHCRRPSEPDRRKYLAWAWKPKPRKGARHMEDICRSEDCYGPAPATALLRAWLSLDTEGKED